MPPQSRLIELIVRWQELQAEGKQLTVEEVCADCPELAAPLRQQIEWLGSLGALLGTEQGGVTPSPETVSARPADLPTTRQVGRYRVEYALGSGGMGAVYAADDPQLQRRIALKVPHFAGSPERQEQARRRFLREARSAAAVQHPNVCPIHDVGEHEGRPFVVLALIDGESLASRLERPPRYTDREAVGLAIKIAAGLGAVHAHGIIHRDLKPGNILLRSKDGEPVLTDFGLAQSLDDQEKLTADGSVVGTPAYMAPEQADPTLGPVTARSDLYSLGVVLFEIRDGDRAPPPRGVDDHNPAPAGRRPDSPRLRVSPRP
jgi:serine/threonine protein kinase